MNSTGDLTPTIITDKNGRITTVHKKNDSDVGTSVSIPAPSLLRSAFDFGRTKRINKAALINETLTQLDSFRAHDGSPMFNEAQLERIKERFEEAKNNKELKVVSAGAEALTTTRDREFIYRALCQYYPTDGKRGLLVLGNHLDILIENPNNAERLYRLDDTLTARYGLHNDAETEVSTLRPHLLAKIDYPFGEGFDNPIVFEESRQYEMSMNYVEFVQKRPELVSELMRFARAADDERFLNYTNLDILTNVADEMPERLDEFLTAVENRGGVEGLHNFLDERGLDRYEKSVIESYLDTHAAVDGGWL
jgi:hypothetical protein